MLKTIWKQIGITTGHIIMTSPIVIILAIAIGWFN